MGKCAAIRGVMFQNEYSRRVSYNPVNYSFFFYQVRTLSCTCEKVVYGGVKRQENKNVAIIWKKEDDHKSDCLFVVLSWQHACFQGAVEDCDAQIAHAHTHMHTR